MRVGFKSCRHVGKIVMVADLNARVDDSSEMWKDVIART